MTRYMYDSVNPSAIPSSATMVAGYADGLYANIPALKARFPHATIVSIAVKWTTRAQVLDVETGDATPAQAVTWCTKTMADKSNKELTVYCNTSMWPQVRAAFRAAGVTEPNYWVAAYDGNATVPAGAVAKQYQGDTNGYDKSVVADYWPGVDSSPAPAPTPAPAADPQWLKLLAHILAVPEGIYEHWVSGTGWDNHTVWGVEYGEDGVPYCVIGAWDQFHECGLDSAVPKTDNVNDFAAWARANGEWTEWPSVCAWADFGDGAHCELVIGFTADKVITKGWNSVQTGAADSGQGNGVWVHVNDRTDPRITGYLAPRFPDGICPPTANPHDPRGGAALTEYTAPEDLMPISDTDAQKIALAVLSYKNANALKANPNLPDVYGYIVGSNGALASLTAQVGALSGAITALTKAGGITAEQVTAAAEAGAKAALDELAQALGKATA